MRYVTESFVKKGGGVDTTEKTVRWRVLYSYETELVHVDGVDYLYPNKCLPRGLWSLIHCLTFFPDETYNSEETIQLNVQWSLS